MTPVEIADATRGQPRSEPRVSVVIPAYNVEGKIAETIEAVAARTCRDDPYDEDAAGMRTIVTQLEAMCTSFADQHQLAKPVVVQEPSA